jgi:hypothetical protein
MHEVCKQKNKTIPLANVGKMIIILSAASKLGWTNICTAHLLAMPCGKTPAICFLIVSQKNKGLF